MTDLHTHILPGMDDGAKTPDESIAMLRAQYAQGVDMVALTPHFYPERENCERFLQRRSAAWEQLKTAILALPQQERAQLPRLVLGAEVAFMPGLENIEGLQRLCIGNTKNMLLELPFYPWGKSLIRQLYGFLGQVGVTPVLAHIERYFSCQSKRALDEVLELGLPVQVGADALTWTKSPVMKLIKQGKGHLIASDCHDLVHRPPNMAAAMQAIEKKLGAEYCEELKEMAAQLAVKE